MTGHAFIFSQQRRHRIARHVVFWGVWCLAFNVLFHFPIHVYKGWNISGPGTRNLQELGLPLFFIKTLIVNSFFAVIVPQIVLVYLIMYWLLPDYYYPQRNYVVSAIVTLCVLCLFFCIAVACKYSPVAYNYFAKTDTTIPPVGQMQQFVLNDQMNSLPIILGFALMIKLIKRWWLKQKETEQLIKEKTNAELQLLKEQVHPHFLFNTLNNIYFFTLSNSTQAAVMIKKLSDLLNYILNECNQPLVPLEKEIQMLQDYVTLEKIRYGEDRQLTITISGDYKDKLIHPLLLIPFVENSFKHGASKMIADPYVKLNIRIENNWLHFMVSNNKPEANDVLITKGSIGLKNVTKRLQLLYPNTHELNIVSQQERYVVTLMLRLLDVKDLSIQSNVSHQNGEYAKA